MGKRGSKGLLPTRVSPSPQPSPAGRGGHEFRREREICNGRLKRRHPLAPACGLPFRASSEPLRRSPPPGAPGLRGCLKTLPFTLSLSKGRGAVHGSTSSPRTSSESSPRTVSESSPRTVSDDLLDTLSGPAGLLTSQNRPLCACCEEIATCIGQLLRKSTHCVHKLMLVSTVALRK